MYVPIKATTATRIKAVLIITSHILKLRLGAAFVLVLAFMVVEAVEEEACFISVSSPAPVGAAPLPVFLVVILLSVVGVGVGVGVGVCGARRNWRKACVCIVCVCGVLVWCGDVRDAS